MSALNQRRAILREIAALGPVLPGSITKRLTRCQTEGCHCRADPPQLHGPYFVWTHRSGGRQITTSITPEEANLLRPLIAEDRRLHRLIHELETLGAQETVERNRQQRSLGSSVRKTGITTTRHG